MATVIRGSDNFDSADVGKVLQVVNFQTGTSATGSTTMPHDNTIPQITEGVEYMTLAITPTSATSTLKIDVVAHLTASGTGQIAAALFEGTTANALAAINSSISAANLGVVIAFTHTMTAGVATALTFRVRAGTAAARTVTFTGQGTADLLGGVLASSITITEIKA